MNILLSPPYFSPYSPCASTSTLISSRLIPSQIQRHFRQQGVGGPTYNPISGNSTELRRMMMMMAEHKSPDDTSFNNDHVVQQVITHYFWSKVYGDQFLFWFGSRPRLAIVDPDMIKKVLLNRDWLFRKAQVNPLVNVVIMV